MEFLMQTIQFPQSVDDLAITKFRLEVDLALQSDMAIVLVDFNQVESIGSLGLMVLMQSFKCVRAAEKKLFICSVNKKVQMLLELTGMDQVFEVFVRPHEVNEVEQLALV